MLHKVLFVDGIPEHGKRIVENVLADDVDAIEFVPVFDREQISAYAATDIIFRSWQNPPAWLSSIPSISSIHRIGAVANRQMMFNFAQEDLACAILPDSVHVNLAEHTMMFILALNRRYKSTEHALRVGHNPNKITRHEAKNRSDAYNWAAQPGIHTLAGKTVGILGFGETGYQILKRLRPFDLRCIYYNRNPIQTDLPDLQDLSYVSFETIFKESDFVVSLIPYTEENHGLIGAEQFKQMAADSYFILPGRANVVEQGALLTALYEEQIAGAALDVFWEEPLPTDSVFTELDNVLLSPHVGGGSNGFYDTMQQIATNLQCLRRGESLCYGQI